MVQPPDLWGCEMAMLKPMDLVLILLHKNDNPRILEGITRIEKLAYLASLSPRFSDLKKELQYEPFHYGPYSDVISKSLDKLLSYSFVESDVVVFEMQKNQRADEISLENEQEVKEYVETRNYRLSPKGKALAQFLYENKLTPEQRKEIDRLVQEYGSLELKDLIKRVYAIAPPDMLARSRIRDEMMCN